MAELKPCPFCGDTECLELCQDKNHPKGADMFIACQLCQVAGPSAFDEDSAIHRWNERLPELPEVEHD